MLISVIIPATGAAVTTAAVDRVVHQPGDCEVIVVNPPPDFADAQSARDVILATASTEGVAAQFNAGADSARGEVLLFLLPEIGLPSEALLAIERNFELLPRTVGGNFHLHFEPDTFIAGMIIRLVKWNRYRRRYGLEGGLFVRRDIFRELGGFNPRLRSPDRDFTRRLEQAGPTLYLPEAVTVPWAGVRHGLQLLFGVSNLNYGVAHNLGDIF